MTSPPPPRRVPWRSLSVAAALVLVAALALWVGRPSLIREDDVRATVLATIQSEAPERFLVTGTLQSGVATEGARRWRVPVLNLETGRSTVRVAVPGRMSYGFSLDALAPSDIRFLDGGIVEIALPELAVFSVEPVLDSARVTVSATGAGRLSPQLAGRTMESTLRRVRPALRRQAEAHLATADGPALNTAEALAALLRTPLQAAGVEGARFRFILAPGDTLVLDGGGGRVRTLHPRG